MSPQTSNPAADIPQGDSAPMLALGGAPNPGQMPNAGQMDARSLADRVRKAFAPAVHLTATGNDELQEALRRGKLGAFQTTSGFAACLIPLLTALKWRGEPRALAEALPHFTDELDLTGFRNTLASLGYVTRGARMRLCDIDIRLFPCVYLPRDGGYYVVRGVAGNGQYDIYDGRAKTDILLDAGIVEGAAFFITRVGEQTLAAQPHGENWMGGLARRFLPLARQMLAVTAALNLLALISPLFTMAIYDKVIPAHSGMALFYLAIGVLIALASDLALRSHRARLIAYVGSRIDNIVGVATLDQILNLPPGMIENAPIGGQVSRIREFANVREFFTGSWATILLELPFTLLFIGVIAALAGPIAFVPAGMIAIFTICALALLPSMRASVRRSSAARATRHSFLVETISNLRAIKQANGENVWRERFREISAHAALTGFRSTQLSFLLQTISGALMTGAGVATLAWGCIRVMDNQMSVGALVAVMALVWRVLSPLQSAMVALVRLEQVRIGFRQVNSLMRMRTERNPGMTSPTRRNFAGRVSFSRVSHRYAADAEPAILGVSFNIDPGKIVAIVGPSGAGKSTIIKLTAGMYHAQAGQVAIDGIDIRQLDPVSLRQSIGYLPQQARLFHGTIAQNLRLAQPTASDEQVIAACRAVQMLDEIEALPEGLETRIGDQAMNRLGSGFRQRLALARLYLQNAPLVLLDEPANGLDNDGDAAFVATIEKLRGRATIIMATHRPSHMKLADVVIYMNDGVIVFAGTPDEALARMQGPAQTQNSPLPQKPAANPQPHTEAQGA